MKDEINKIIQSISDFYKLDNALKYYLDRHKAQILLDYITNLQEENKRLKELCDKYEEEHNTTFIEWQKDIKANKKAIEYINSTGYGTDFSMSAEEVDKVLNILQGEQNE